MTPAPQLSPSRARAWKASQKNSARKRSKPSSRKRATTIQRSELKSCGTNCYRRKENWGVHLNFLRASSIHGCFPLTPALSLGEREKNFQRSILHWRPRLFHVGEVRPLPEGEGWG